MRLQILILNQECGPWAWLFSGEGGEVDIQSFVCLSCMCQVTVQWLLFYSLPCHVSATDLIYCFRACLSFPLPVYLNYGTFCIWLDFLSLQILWVMLPVMDLLMYLIIYFSLLCLLFKHVYMYSKVQAVRYIQFFLMTKSIIVPFIFPFTRITIMLKILSVLHSIFF